MKVVTNRTDFLAMFDDDGIPLEPFTVKRGVAITELSHIRSLNGVVLKRGVWLSGLTNLATLSGCVFSKRVSLFDLTNLVDIVPNTIPIDVRLFGLDNVKINLGPLYSKTLELLQRIPLDKVRMGNPDGSDRKHIATWIQLLTTGWDSPDAAYEDCYHEIPSLQPYLYGVDTNKMVKYLRSLHTNPIKEN